MLDLLVSQVLANQPYYLLLVMQIQKLPIIHLQPFLQI